MKNKYSKFGTFNSEIISNQHEEISTISSITCNEVQSSTDLIITNFQSNKSEENSSDTYKQHYEKSNFISHKNFQEFFNTEIVYSYLSNRLKNCEKQISNCVNKKDFLSKHTDYQNKLFTTLAEQIGTLRKDLIIAIPVYAGEEDLSTLIQVLKNNLNKDSHAILYVNAPKNFLLEDFKKKLELIKSLTETNDDLKIVSHMYEQRETIATIRADMIGAIIKASEKPKDKIIVGLDADTYFMSPDYIEKTKLYFEKNESAPRVASSLKWSEIEQHPVAWISELIMQMNYAGGVMNADDNKTPHSFGAVTSFRLQDYIKIGGYHRDLEKFEDLYLGMEMNKLANQKPDLLNTLVKVHPRRGIQAIENGATFGDQWNGDFMPINDTQKCGEPLSTIIYKLKNKGLLDNQEKQIITEFINKHFRFELTRTKTQDNLINKWNEVFPDSCYKVKKRGSRLILLPKIDDNSSKLNIQDLNQDFLNNDLYKEVNQIHNDINGIIIENKYLKIIPSSKTQNIVESYI